MSMRKEVMDTLHHFGKTGFWMTEGSSHANGSFRTVEPNTHLESTALNLAHVISDVNLGTSYWNDFMMLGYFPLKEKRCS